MFFCVSLMHLYFSMSILVRFKYVLVTHCFLRLLRIWPWFLQAAELLALHPWCRWWLQRKCDELSHVHTTTHTHMFHTYTPMPQWSSFTLRKRIIVLHAKTTSVLFWWGHSFRKRFTDSVFRRCHKNTCIICKNTCTICAWAPLGILAKPYRNNTRGVVLDDSDSRKLL